MTFMKIKYDYIICGAGLSGLILANKIFEDSDFDKKQILIIEKNLSDPLNKTWCFWEKKNSSWDDYVIKSWDKLLFNSPNFKNETFLSEYSYKMIKSEFFIKSIIQKIRNSKNFEIIEDDVLGFDESKDRVIVKTKSNKYLANQVLNSVVDIEKIKSESSFPFLLQHFLGWTIETEHDFFDDNKATIMDFNIDQNNETRFFYVLPISRNKALIEFTIFSKKLLEKKNYDIELKKYLSNLNLFKYDIVEKEFGVIPMTCHPFDNSNTDRILNIGTAGGWTKPSSGYTFKYIDKNTDKLIVSLKNNMSFSKISFKSRHWIYDLILLDVLFFKNYMGSVLFTKMFSKNSMKKIFSFLDNESSLIEELKIASSFPKVIFTKSLLRNLGKILKYYL